MIATLLLLQAAPVAGPVLVVPPAMRVTAACTPGERGADDAIVVCGRRDEPDRLRPMPERYVKPPPRAEVKVMGNARLSAEADQGVDAQGSPINRAMVRLKIPF